MYRGKLFVQVENESENGGFFCANSNSCQKTNEGKVCYAILDLYYMWILHLCFFALTGKGKIEIFLYSITYNATG